MPLPARAALLATTASALLLAASVAVSHDDPERTHPQRVAQAQPGAPAGATPEAPAAVPRVPRPPDALLYIVSPVDGATVDGPVTVRFGLRGMGVAPAGVARPDTGHHHLVVDAPTPPLDRPLPADERHIHFGGGQTETTLELAPGPHELQLVLADQDHVPHDPPLVSERIRITVR
jgi:hypothetical protein